MANQLNTLYPPQVNTFMPAFSITSTSVDEGSGAEKTSVNDAVVYYSLSPYNEISKIHFLHVSVVDQKTNDNALINPNGVFIVQFNPETDYDESTGMYRVVIPNARIKNVEDNDGSTGATGNSNFKINQFYKVQLRFDQSEKLMVTKPNGERVEVSAESINSADYYQQLGSYLIESRYNFSEWSSICLIRPISDPGIYIRPWDYEDFDDTHIQGYNKGLIPITGFVAFEPQETETMQYYQFQVLDENGEHVLLETDKIFTGTSFDPNDINYKLDVQGLDTETSSNFILRVIITTKNQYTKSKEYRFQIVGYIEDEYFDPVINVEVDNDDALAIVTVKNAASLKGVLYIRRASSKTEFKEWEDVYVANVNGPVDVQICDNTICSMVWYRYLVQYENEKRGMSQAVKTDKIFPDFYDAVFSRGSKQLSVRYNYVISSFKPVVNRSKVDTLGGKYPKFMENGAINYKQFTISGLISTQEDPGQKFMNKKNNFGTNYNNYEVYKYNRSITEYYDYLWERDFREEVMAWLNDGEPKLYRSQTEGNLCVILTDISLTPNKTLSRRIWDFSATVYEVAEGMSMSDLHNLGIYNIYADGMGGDGITGGWAPSVPADPPESSDLIWKVGQTYEYNVTSTGVNFVRDVIGAHLDMKYTGYLKNRKPMNLKICDVRIFFHGKPHMYLQTTDGHLTRLTNLEYDRLNEATKKQIVMGYRFEIQNSVSSSAPKEEIFVDTRGYYEFPTDVNVTQLYFPDASDGSVSFGSHYEDGRKPEYVTVEYVMVYKETPDSKSIISTQYVERTVVGQITGTWDFEEYLSSQINEKYSYADQDGFRKMMSWKGISLDVTPYALFKIKYVDDHEFQTYEVGHGGYLGLMPEFKISDMCFTGVRMVEKPIERAAYLEDWEFVYADQNSYDSVNDIRSPLHNGVYLVLGNYKIYYRHSWYAFVPDENGTGVAEVPVSGAVNYLGDIIYSAY